METPVKTETQIELDLDQIMEELDRSGRELPVAAIRAAQQQREAITPRLIEAIRHATAEAWAGNRPEGNAHFFAFFLLAEFQAKEAWPAIREAISLPDPFEIFGDATNDTLARALVVMIGDQLEAIDELIRDRKLDQFIRWECAQTYCHLMVTDRLPRETAVGRLQQLLREAIDNEDVEIIAPLISVLADMGAREARDEIERAFRLELVDESLIDLDSVEIGFTETDSTVRERIRRFATGPILDTVAELATWSPFAEGEYDDSEDDFLDDDDDDFDDAGFRSQSGETLLHQSLWLNPLTESSQQPLVDESAEGEAVDLDGTVRHTGPRIGRNDPCPCGSGKKYKKCCGGRK